MAQAINIITSSPYLRADAEPFSLTMDWVSAADGSGSFKLTEQLKAAHGAHSPYPNKVCGKIVALEAAPGANGDATTDTPTTGYDIMVKDAYGVDLADASLTVLASDKATKIIPLVPVLADSEITLVIANAGNGKKGRLIIHFE